VALLSMRFVSICFNQSCCLVIGTAADSIHGYRLSAVDGLLWATPRRISDSRNDPDRLVLRKYDPAARQHVQFREER
jgi:large subunit ribosomal protein L33